MLTIVPIVVLFFSGFFIILSGRLSISSGKVWLVAAISGFIVWGLLIMIRIILPGGLVITTQLTQTGLPAFTAFKFNEQNWVYAFLLVNLMLAVLLYEARHLDHKNDDYLKTLAGSLFLTGCGLLSVISNSERAFAITWGLFDLVELSILLIIVRDPGKHKDAVTSLFLRILGVAVIFILMSLKSTGNGPILLQNLKNPLMVMILLIGVLRSGVLTRPPALSPDLHFRRGAGSLLRVIPPITVFSFLSYSMPLPMEGGVPVFVLYILAGIALLGAIRWVTSINGLEGRSSWHLAIIALALVASIRGQQGVLFSLSVLLLTIGPLLTLSSMRVEKSRWFLLLPIFAFFLLPFSPSSPIRAFLAAGSFSLDILLFGAGYLFLVIGSIRHLFEPVQGEGETENWMKFFHTLGLVILSVLSWAVGLFFFKEVATLQYWWLSVVLLGLVLGIIFLCLGKNKPGNRFFTSFLELPVVRGIFRFLTTDAWRRAFIGLIDWLIKAVRSILGLVQRVLEGDGGIFWSLLFLAILASLLLAEQVP